MSTRQIDWIFYIVDEPSGNCWYRDDSGNVQSISILAAGINIDVSIKRAPDGWMNQELGFIRAGAQRGYGFNRSYSIPQKLVDDAAYIVRWLTYRGRGIEVPLAMVVFKYNDSPETGDPLYELYYKGLIDLPNSKNIAAEGVQCNLMEGGVVRWLKAIENTVIEIPCDGSIPENIKVNLDGMLLEDVLNYSITPISGGQGGNTTIGMVFIDHEGDNFGIVHNDPQQQSVGSSGFSGTYFQQSPDWAMNSQEKITVLVEGEITIAPTSNTPFAFDMFIATSKTAEVSGVLQPTIGLIPKGASRVTIGTTEINCQQVLTFSAYVTLDALENIFIQMDVASVNYKIIGGACRFHFASKAPATSPWCITLYDIGKLLVKYGSELLSTSEAPVNLAYQSNLLLNNLNVVATSGDALRASGDPNYQKFYNAPHFNPQFPNIVLASTYGPVLKTTIADFFSTVNALFCASMSSRIISGQNETLFIESRGYVFDSSVVNLDNGEVSEFSDGPALDLLFTLFKIGYEPKSDDQKSGKYAWNTTAEWIAPLKSIPSKTMEVISKYIFEPYLIERVRADISDTSTTRNNSDTSVFGINRDLSSSQKDGFSASFTSLLTDVTNPANTDIFMRQRWNFQNFPLNLFKGNYLAFSTSISIFLFNQATLSGTSMPLALSFTGNLFGNPANPITGQPVDSVQFDLYINGVIVQSFITTVTGVSTPISISYTLTRAWSFKDSIYMKATTSLTGSVANLSGTLKVGTGGVYLTSPMTDASIASGITNQLLTFDTPTAQLDVNSLPVISWGFQYYYFNSILINSNFDLSFSCNGALNVGTPGNTATVDIWFNGVSQNAQIFTAGGTVTPFTLVPFSFNKTLQIGDIFFVTGSTQNINMYIFNALLTAISTQITASNLKRVQYDAIYGIPTLLGTLPGTSIPITTGPGAPYNLEDVTPKRMLMGGWASWMASLFYDQIPGVFQFSTLSKNQFLSTRLGSTVFTENADVEISDFGARLFKARYLYFKTRVQETFSEIMTGAANAFVNQTYMGVPFPGFPFEMKQKPALNEVQNWKLLCGPNVDLTQLIDLNDNGLTFSPMSPNSIGCSFLSPIQFVPSGAVLPSKYHTKSRNQFWFSEQITNWIQQNNYWQPWQTGDPLSLQFRTRDLNAIVVNVYSCSNSATPVLTPSCTLKTSPAVIAPYFLWEVVLDLSSLPSGVYYLTAVGGTGGAAATLISEGIWLQPDWPETSLLEYTSSQNKQSFIFDTGTIFAMRFFGFFDNRFKQRYKGAFYVDQPQDISILNAIPYETTTLWCGGQEGQPDYVTKKISRMLLLDGAMIEGEGFSMNENAEWSEVFIPGCPKKFQEIEIRPSQNIDGISATAAGVDMDSSMITTINAGAMGPNAGNAGSSDPGIISIKKS